MTPAEVAVLSALTPDHTLTATQIQQFATLTSWRTRNALAQLESQGLIIPTQPRGRWRITPRGRTALTMKARRFG
ncbi:hypothetical protein GL305_07710 [Nocardia seriolae]|uniref:MarR family transcriptional regulator n=1 Tax=Nocardia seriolae TaxID=37332 RepID=A0ABC9YX71_9NOCA|nr:hypothetical protein [Nocardia seriolae]GEM25181.1 hypothetical protein NS2_34200 [Nocardia seriolae NBRC 15557]APA95704.1 hypothetical protein NS506_01634 [Nocardia seriolae]MTJ75612.1 hypothetical protein [Nocardia seriolae]MTJ85908.1 hypothetical protein [Nocardia seriolae]MTK29902.1 hypothetical protein [Nocardia seriolae]